MRQYLGDGAYADYDGYHVKLTAENGLMATDTVYLNPQVMRALTRYWDSVRTAAAIVRAAEQAPEPEPGPEPEQQPEPLPADKSKANVDRPASLSKSTIRSRTLDS